MHQFHTKLLYIEKFMVYMEAGTSIYRRFDFRFFLNWEIGLVRTLFPLWVQRRRFPSGELMTRSRPPFLRQLAYGLLDLVIFSTYKSKYH